MSLRKKFSRHKRVSVINVDPQERASFLQLVKDQQAFLAKHIDSENSVNTPLTPPRNNQSKKERQTFHSSPRHLITGPPPEYGDSSNIFSKSISKSNVLSVKTENESTPTKKSNYNTSNTLEKDTSKKPLFSPKRLSFFKKREEEISNNNNNNNNNISSGRRPTFSGLEDLARKYDNSESFVFPPTVSSQISNPKKVTTKQKKLGTLVKTVNSMSTSMGNIIKKADVRNVWKDEANQLRKKYNQINNNSNTINNSSNSQKNISKVFGVKLTELMLYQRQDDRFKNVSIPVFIKHTIDFLKSYGLLEKGIFRISPSHEELNSLKEKIDQNGPRFDFKFPFGTEKVPLIAALLKKYLRELPISLIPISLLEILERKKLVVSDNNSEIEPNLDLIKKHLLSIPHAHYSLLRELFYLLSDVANHSSINSMTASNIATIFALNVIHADDTLSKVSIITKFVELLVSNARKVLPTQEELWSMNDLIIPENDPSNQAEIENISELSEMGHILLKGKMFKKTHQTLPNQRISPKRMKVESSRPMISSSLTQSFSSKKIPSRRPSQFGEDEDEFFEIEDANEMFGMEKSDEEVLFDDDERENRLSVMAFQFSNRYCSQQKPNFKQLKEAASDEFFTTDMESIEENREIDELGQLREIASNVNFPSSENFANEDNQVPKEEIGNLLAVLGDNF